MDQDNTEFTTASSPTEKEIQEWMVSYLSSLLKLEKEKIDITMDFENWGLDSTAAVGLVGDLEEWLDQELPPTLAYEYPNIKLLSDYLANQKS